MKRVFGIFVLSMLILSMGIGIVSANPVEDLVGGIGEVYEALEPAFGVLVGETATGARELLFAKFLLMLIIFSIAWTALERMPILKENDWVIWVVSISVSVLSVRFLSNDIVNTIVLPYSAFGIALTAGIPFLLYFFIVEGFNRTARRISWVFFAVIFLGLWYTRAGSGSAVGAVGGFAYIYLVTAILALVMLTMDGTIQRFRARMKAEKAMSIGDRRRYIKLQEELENVNKRYYDNPDEYKAIHSSVDGRKGWAKDVSTIMGLMTKLGV